MTRKNFRMTKKKTKTIKRQKKCFGYDLFSRPPAETISSALSRFTSEFGMEIRWDHDALITKASFILTE